MFRDAIRDNCAVGDDSAELRESAVPVAGAVTLVREMPPFGRQGAIRGDADAVRSKRNGEIPY